MAAVEERSHAAGFGALHGYKAHVAANVVAIDKVGEPRFVVVGVLLETEDACLKGLAKTGADFEAFLSGAGDDHANLPRAGLPVRQSLKNNFGEGLKFLRTMPIVADRVRVCQITVLRRITPITST
jgi:hypothetical protein